MKRIAFCFDGTWNKIDSRNSTNVARVAQSIACVDQSGVRQLIHYDEGVGTGYRRGRVAKLLERLKGGALGKGLDQNLIEAYHFLVLNYEPGDEIFLFGFSRGAFTARSFAGMIRNCGIMSRRSLEHIGRAVDFYFSRDEQESATSDRAHQFRFDHCPRLSLPDDDPWRTQKHGWTRPPECVDLRVKYLGVWDTVGALGVPGWFKSRPLFGRQYEFHDTALSRFVCRARHAVAADETRRTYEPTLWSNLAKLDASHDGPPRYEQQVFPGNHTGVGGGGPVRGLSDAALDWVLRGAIEEGLAVDEDATAPIHTVSPDHRAQVYNRSGGMGPSIKDGLMGLGLRPRVFRARKIDETGKDEVEEKAEGIGTVDISRFLLRRYAAPAADLAERKPYRPMSLEPFWGDMERMAADALAAPAPGDALWDDRLLEAPEKATRYVVKPGDTLATIARAEMGGVDDWKILFLHNRNIGRLDDPDSLYVDTEIEIPRYAERRPPAA